MRSAASHTPVHLLAPSMPLLPYSSDAYVTPADRDEPSEHDDDEWTPEQRNPFSGRRDPLAKLLPLRQSAWAENVSASQYGASAVPRTQSGLPIKGASVIAVRPEPLSYLPERSPTKRAWRRQQLLQQQAQALMEGSPMQQAAAATGRRAARTGASIPPVPAGHPPAGGLFAEYLARVDAIGADDAQHCSATDVLQAAMGGNVGRHSYPTEAAGSVAASARHPGLPSASPVAEVLALIRSKREAREIAEGKRSAVEASSREASLERERDDSREGRRRSRTRSRSRSRSRSNPRSAAIRDAAFSPTVRHKAAARGSCTDSIDATLLQSFLQPLGLKFSTLAQLSAADIERLAEAVRANSVSAAFPRPVTSAVLTPAVDRPLDPRTRQATEEQAAKQLRRAHFIAHARTQDAAAAKYTQEHPSMVALRAQRPYVAPAVPASGDLLLPADPLQTAAAAEAARKARLAREAHGPVFAIRVEKPEDKAVAPATGTTVFERNEPLEQVVPPSALQQLLNTLGGEDTAPPLKGDRPASASAQLQHQRSVLAIERLRASQHAKDAAPRERILAAREAVDALDASVRQRNRAKLQARKSRRSASVDVNRDAAAAPTTAAASSAAASARPAAAAPRTVSPRLFVQHLRVGSIPSDAFTLKGLMGRVVWRTAEQWQQIDSSPSGAEISSETQQIHALSSSPFSFVFGPDSLQRLLQVGLGRESTWLASLGFEKSWIGHQLAQEGQLKLIVFRGEEASVSATAVKGDNKQRVSVRAHRATWATVFDVMLPRVLAANDKGSAAENEQKRVVLERLRALREEVSTMSWSAVHARAQQQGLDHVYEQREPLGISDAALSVQCHRFDVVQARRFLHDHLHLTALFTGDGFATPEAAVSQSEEAAADATSSQRRAKPRTQQLEEFVIETVAIHSLPGVKMVPLNCPLPSMGGRDVSSSRSRSRSRALASEHRASSAPRSVSPSPCSSSIAVAVPSRGRSRSRNTRPLTSSMDTGLKLKPGTAAFEEIKARKIAQDAAIAKSEADRIQAAKDAQRAERAAKAAARQKDKPVGGESKKPARKKLDSGAGAPAPTSSFKDPFDFGPSSSTAVPITTATAVPAEAKDEYADDFEAPASAENASSSVAAHVPDSGSVAIATPAPSSVMAAALAAAAGGHLTAPDVKEVPKKKLSKKKRSSSKGEKPKSDSKPAELPRKPAVPPRTFPVAPKLAGKAGEAAKALAEQSTSNVASSSPESSRADLTPAAAPKPSPAVPLTAEEEKRRKHAILVAQKAQRKAKELAAAKQRDAQEEKRKANLRALQQTCNAIVRPQSAAPAVAASASGDAPATVAADGHPTGATAAATSSTSAPRARSLSASRGRRSRSHSRSRTAREMKQDRLAEAEMGLPSDEQLDSQVAAVMWASDLMDSDAAKKKQYARMAQEAEERARKTQADQERNMRQLVALERKNRLAAAAAENDGATSDRDRSASPVAGPPRRPSPPPSRWQPLVRGAVPALVQRGIVSRSRSPPSRGTPSPSVASGLAASASNAANAGEPAAISVSVAPMQSQSADPRVADMVNKAQQLSTRFSSLLQRLSEHSDGAGGFELSRHATVAAALQSSPAPAARQSSETSDAQLDHQAALQQLQRAVHDQAVAEREERVRREIVPPTHLQEPFALLQPASRLDASRRGSVTALSPLLDEATPSWAASVLLPASLSAAPFPAGFNHAPLPHGESASYQALLVAEHSPDASTFLSGLATSGGSAGIARPTGFVFGASPPAAAGLGARPYYDLANREYEDLQERIRQQKARFQFLAAGH